MTAFVPWLMTNFAVPVAPLKVWVTENRCQLVVTVLALGVPVGLVVASMRRLTVAVPEDVFIQTLAVKVPLPADTAEVSLMKSVEAVPAPMVSAVVLPSGAAVESPVTVNVPLLTHCPVAVVKSSEYLIRFSYLPMPPNGVIRLPEFNCWLAPSSRVSCAKGLVVVVDPNEPMLTLFVV